MSSLHSDASLSSVHAELEERLDKLQKGETERVAKMDKLQKELEKEREMRTRVTNEKASLEEELESLSQALFEEASYAILAREQSIDDLF